MHWRTRIACRLIVFVRVTWVNESTTTTSRTMTTNQSTTINKSTTVTQNMTTTQSLSFLTAVSTVSVSVSMAKFTIVSSNPSSPTSCKPRHPTFRDILLKELAVLRSKHENALVIGLPAGIGFLALVVVALICYYFYQRQLNRARHQPQVDLLEEELSFIPRSPPALSIPQWTPASTISSPTSPESFLVTQSPEQEYYSMAPSFFTRQSQDALNSLSATVSRQSTQGQPPGYYESVSSHRRASRGAVRKSRSVLSNPD